MSTLDPALAVSTWSLHRRLERPEIALLHIPAEVAAHGLSKLEICHFHFPSTDDAYLADLRGALSDASIDFLTLLVDTGDPTHPDPAERQRQLDMMAGWIDVAAKMGAKRARVIAGDAEPSEETLEISATGMRALAKRAEDSGVRLEVENWHRLLDRPAEVLWLLEKLDGKLGLKLDFGNWPNDRKHDDLPKIAQFAESTHAKAHFPKAGEMDTADFGKCLDLCHSVGFVGPHSLIFDGPGDEWDSLDMMRDFTQAHANR